MVREAWGFLGVAPTDDRREIKRAYARLLKQIDVDADPGAFVQLREAFELADHWGVQIPEWEQEEEPPVAVGCAHTLDDPALETTHPGVEYQSGNPVPWVPPRPAFSEVALATLCERLDGLLFDHPAPDPSDIAATGREIIERRERTHVGDAAALESWLASAIAAAIPRSDPLIDMAAHRFGWTSARNSRDWGYDMDLEQIRQRIRDRVFRDQCQMGTHSQAFAELTGPTRAKLRLREMGLAAEVRKFLTLIRAEHTTVEKDLDATAVAWWDDYLRKPRLPDSFWMQMLVGSVVMMPVIHISIGIGESGAGFFAILVGSVVTTFGLILLLVPVRARFAARRQARIEQGFVPGQVEPFLVPALLVVPVAALFPPSPLAGLGWAAISAYVALAIHIRAYVPPDETESEAAQRRAFMPTILIAALAAFFALSFSRAGNLVVPLAMLSLVGWQSFHPVALRLAGLPPARLKTLLAATAVGVAIVLVLPFLTLPQPPSAWMVVLLPVTAVATQLVTSTSYSLAPWTEWPLRVAAICLFLGAPALLPSGSVGPRFFLAAAFYVTSNALVRLYLAIREARPTY